MTERPRYFDADSFTAGPFTEHVAGLRRLAQSLVRCPANADDAVQETLARAVAAPWPTAAGRVGAWLRTILRNVVTSEHRQRSRREVRDQQSRCDAAPAPSALDLIARRETLERVSRAITALPAPLQSVVFLRHFDDLPPREIAARLALDVAVVHRRLHRAHAELRRSLAAEGRDRSWRAGLVGLFGERGTPTFPTEGPLPWVAFFSRASIMTLTSKLTLGAAAVFALALPFLLRDPEVPSAPAAAVAEAETQLAERRDAAGDTEPERNDVAASEDDKATPTADLEPHEFELLVRATDQDDYPARMAVFLAPLHHPLNLVGRTDGDGTLLVKWRGRSPSAQIVIAENVRRTSLRRLEVVAGVRAEVALRSTARFRSASGHSRAYASNLAIVAEARIVDFGRDAESPPRAIELADGSIRFVHSASEAEDTPAPIAAGPRLRVAFADGAVQLSSATDQQVATTQIEVLVRDALGRPVDGALIAAFTGERVAPRFRTRTDSAGRATIPSLQPGPWRIRAGGGEHGIAMQEFELDGATPQIEWQANLDRGAELLGRLLDATGTPLQGWSIHAESSDESGAWADETRSAEDGTFAIPNVPQRLHALRITQPPDTTQDEAITLPPAWCGDLWPTVSPVDIVVAQPARANATLQASLHLDATQRDGLQVRLWHSESAHGTSLPLDFRSADDPRVLALVVSGLAPGAYELQIGGAAIAWREFGHVQLTAQQTTDLGVSTFDLPSRLTLPGARSSGQLLVELDHGYSVIEWWGARSQRSLGSDTVQLVNGSTFELRGASTRATEIHFGDQKGVTRETAIAAIAEQLSADAHGPVDDPTTTADSTVDLAPGRYLWIGASGARSSLELRSGEAASLDAANGGTSRTLTR